MKDMDQYGDRSKALMRQAEMVNFTIGMLPVDLTR